MTNHNARLGWWIIFQFTCINSLICLKDQGGAIVVTSFCCIFISLWTSNYYTGNKINNYKENTNKKIIKMNRNAYMKIGFMIFLYLILWCCIVNPKLYKNVAQKWIKKEKNDSQNYFWFIFFVPEIECLVEHIALWDLILCCILHNFGKCCKCYVFCP